SFVDNLPDKFEPVRVGDGRSIALPAQQLPQKFHGQALDDELRSRIITTSFGIHSKSQLGEAARAKSHTRVGPHTQRLQPVEKRRHNFQVERARALPEELVTVFFPSHVKDHLSYTAVKSRRAPLFGIRALEGDRDEGPP